MTQDEAYRKAEKKIEQARVSGATELDLSIMKLTELPEALGQLTQLRTLDLRSNQLTTLPQPLGQPGECSQGHEGHNPGEDVLW